MKEGGVEKDPVKKLQKKLDGFGTSKLITVINLKIKKERNKKGSGKKSSNMSISNAEEQITLQQELNLCTMYVAGEGDDLLKYFNHKPRKLNKELLEKHDDNSIKFT